MVKEETSGRKREGMTGGPDPCLVEGLKGKLENNSGDNVDRKEGEEVKERDEKNKNLTDIKCTNEIENGKDLSEKEAYTLLAQGKRHFLVKDYSSAVGTLGDCCAKFSQIYGEMGNECGDVYLNYGKALLELAREESGVLGPAIEKEKNVSQQDDDDDEEEDEHEDEDYSENENENENENEMKDKEKTDTGKKEVETSEESKGENSTKKNEKDAEEEEGEGEGEGSGKADIKDTVEKKGDEKEEEEEEEEEEDVNNLQLAWEMLELAKIIFEREKCDEKLADTFLKLGEVSLETENYDEAIEDMTRCLEIQKKILKSDNRVIAEIYFQLGVACSLANLHDKSIGYFKDAKNVLEERIEKLKRKTEPDLEDKVDVFYSIEGEIKEIETIIPEIVEKIGDIEDFKKETLKAITSLKATNTNTNTKGNNAQSCSLESTKTLKSPTDISHLIRKKRKPEETMEQSECKIQRVDSQANENDGVEPSEEPKDSQTISTIRNN